MAQLDPAWTRLTVESTDGEMSEVIDKKGEPLQILDSVSSARRYDDVAVLVPCYNEELTVGKVVRDFRAALPGAVVYVFDNNSTDRTAEHARSAGAVVVRSPRQGKGNVVRHMFEEVDAVYYVMADGDDTYPASAAPELLEIARTSGADMVVGTRLEEHGGRSFRRFHALGNRVISKLVARVFGIEVRDVLSGYRAFSREFVRSVLLSSPGFEVETELTIQAAARRLTITEHPIQYGERPAGSYSKLSTFGDGFLILKLILFIFKNHKPFAFFAMLGSFSILLGLLAGLPAIIDYVRFRYVYHVPLAVLAAALCIVGTLFGGIGVLLSAIRSYHIESLEMSRRLLRQLDAARVKAQSSAETPVRPGNNNGQLVESSRERLK
jgi:glycosyltransferase involved in cell wall biosynthesis